MDKYILVFWTCKSIEEAKSIIYLLLEKKLIACASIIPGIESIYTWNEKVEIQNEVKIILKTQDQHFIKISALIQSLSSYSVPEILKIVISDGSVDYLNWIEQSTT